MKTTKIEWCDMTFSPWIGCSRVSPGCDNCYAERYGKRFGVKWGDGQPRRRTSETTWKQPVRWDRAAKAHDGTSLHNPPLRVFPSLCDWLDPEVPVEWLADFLALIHATPRLNWTLLTKRPEKWRDRIWDASIFLRDKVNIDNLETSQKIASWVQWGEIPSNIWLGVTVENQEQADKRIPELLKIPAAKRFLSVEPLLGPLMLSPSELGGAGRFGDNYQQPQIHWVICGGETGPRARPMHPDWVRSLRDQCQAAGVPFFFKGWGEWLADKGESGLQPERVGWFSPNGKYQPIGEGLKAPDDILISRVGKKAAGRILDGRTWEEVP